MDTTTSPTTIETANGTLHLFQDVKVIGGEHKGLRGTIAMFGTGPSVGLVYVEKLDESIVVVEGVNVKAVR